MARNKGNHDIASSVRGAFLRACKSLDDKWKCDPAKGETALSTIIETQLQERPLDTLRVINGFVPKEMLMQAEVTTRAVEEMTDAELIDYAKRLGSQIGIPISVGGASETEH